MVLYTLFIGLLLLLAPTPALVVVPTVQVHTAPKALLQIPLTLAFIPYDNLTEAICIGWVQDSLGTEGVASLESGLTSNLNEQETPTHAAGVPWSTSG